jgi:hypothetical protein
MGSVHAGDLELQEFAARLAVSKRVEEVTSGDAPAIT